MGMSHPVAMVTALYGGCCLHEKQDPGRVYLLFSSLLLGSFFCFPKICDFTKLNMLTCVLSSRYGIHLSSRILFPRRSGMTAIICLPKQLHCVVLMRNE